ncbi:MAG: acylphosphatase [Chlorobi bacterium]|nr:acylphosphatase [Chlorobiota bacterium]
MEQLVAAKIVVSGRVQGVGYRMFALRLAQQLGLVGTVGNATDGTRVIADVEGSRDAVERFFVACQQGPPRAVVESACIEWHQPSGRYCDFRIIS